MPSGRLQGVTLDNRAFDVVDARGVHDVDQQDKVKKLIQSQKEDTEIFPLMSNFSMAKQDFDPAIGDVLKDPAKRDSLLDQTMRFLGAIPAYRGISLDLEEVPDDAEAGYQKFIGDLYSRLHAKNLRLYVNTGVGAEDQELKFLSANSDAILLMNYDQHETESDPGPIAGQDWFIANLTRVLKIVPKEKVICAIGNYGYDWTMSIPKKKGAKPKVLERGRARQCAGGVDARLRCRCRHRPSKTIISIAHFAYDDEDNNVRHQVWFLDAVTAHEPVARRARSRPADFRSLASRLRRSFAVDRVGQAQQQGCSQLAQEACARARR